MSSAPTDCRVPITPDPTDAKADGGFGNHRAGYSQDKLATAEYWARKGGTLNAGEGLILCAEIDRLRDDLKYAQNILDCLHDEKETLREERDAAEVNAERRWDDIIAAAKKIDRLQRILAKLREPTAAMFDAADLVKPHVGLILRAALDAATWEVSHDAG